MWLVDVLIIHEVHRSKTLQQYIDAVSTKKIPWVSDSYFFANCLLVQMFGYTVTSTAYQRATFEFNTLHFLQSILLIIQIRNTIQLRASRQRLWKKMSKVILDNIMHYLRRGNKATKKGMIIMRDIKIFANAYVQRELTTIKYSCIVFHIVLLVLYIIKLYFTVFKRHTILYICNEIISYKYQLWIISALGVRSSEYIYMDMCRR